MSKPWIGVDFDRTLAQYEGQGIEYFGPPVPRILEAIRAVLSAGIYDVKIFTARVSDKNPEVNAWQRARLQEWCLQHIGQVLEITNAKDYNTVALWDDIAYSVPANTGGIWYGGVSEPLTRWTNV